MHRRVILAPQIGYVLFFVSPDSSDVWANPELFLANDLCTTGGWSTKSPPNRRLDCPTVGPDCPSAWYVVRNFAIRQLVKVSRYHDMRHQGAADGIPVLA